MSSKLERLKAKKASLDALIRREQRKQQKTSRQVENRRLVLIGVVVNEWAKEDSGFGETLRKRLDKFYDRPDERAVLNLPPLEAAPAREPLKIVAQN